MCQQHCWPLSQVLCVPATFATVDPNDYCNNPLRTVLLLTCCESQRSTCCRQADPCSCCAGLLDCEPWSFEPAMAQAGC